MHLYNAKKSLMAGLEWRFSDADERINRTLAGFRFPPRETYTPGQSAIDIVKGKVYEELIRFGTDGEQFYTPRAVVSLLHELVPPELAWDPTPPAFRLPDQMLAASAHAPQTAANWSLPIPAPQSDATPVPAALMSQRELLELCRRQAAEVPITCLCS